VLVVAVVVAVVVAMTRKQISGWQARGLVRMGQQTAAVAEVLAAAHL
jgi:uncharacterized membrane protein